MIEVMKVTRPLFLLWFFVSTSSNTGGPSLRHLRHSPASPAFRPRDETRCNATRNHKHDLRRIAVYYDDAPPLFALQCDACGFVWSPWDDDYNPGE